MTKLGVIFYFRWVLFDSCCDLPPITDSTAGSEQGAASHRWDAVEWRVIRQLEEWISYAQPADDFEICIFLLGKTIWSGDSCSWKVVVLASRLVVSISFQCPLFDQWYHRNPVLPELTDLVSSLYSLCKSLLYCRMLRHQKINRLSLILVILLCGGDQLLTSQSGLAESTATTSSTNLNLLRSCSNNLESRIAPIDSSTPICPADGLPLDKQNEMCKMRNNRQNNFRLSKQRMASGMRSKTSIMCMTSMPEVVKPDARSAEQIAVSAVKQSVNILQSLKNKILGEQKKLTSMTYTYPALTCGKTLLFAARSMKLFLFLLSLWYSFPHI